MLSHCRTNASSSLPSLPSLREWSGIAMVAGGVVLLAFRR
jgi:hypothetical protein